MPTLLDEDSENDRDGDVESTPDDSDYSGVDRSPASFLLLRSLLPGHRDGAEGERGESAERIGDDVLPQRLGRREDVGDEGEDDCRLDQASVQTVLLSLSLSPKLTLSDAISDECGAD